MINMINIMRYLVTGVFPLALVNYITLAGGGFDHVPGAGIMLKSMDELAAEVSLVSSKYGYPATVHDLLNHECLVSDKQNIFTSKPS